MNKNFTPKNASQLLNSLKEESIADFESFFDIISNDLCEPSNQTLLNIQSFAAAFNVKNTATLGKIEVLHN